MRADPARGFDGVASLVQRLAVLTSAGIPAASAWRHVAAAGNAGPAVAEIAREPLPASDLPQRIAATAQTCPPAERSAWQALAAIWAVATESGAALAPTLERSAAVLRSLAQSAREVETALAGPMATSRVVLALPAVGVAFGLLLGFDVGAALMSPPGLVCLVLGGILIAIAVRWNRGLLGWAREHDATSGIEFDLYAVALSGGMSIPRATELVVAVSRSAGLARGDEHVHEVLEFAGSAGVPVVALLRSEADERRRVARAAAAARATRLETRLLLPLGICVLPAFVLLGVMPIALAVLSSTTAAI
ncbi:MAG: type II secretion system F family protein [Pseudolysinimonas sp.]